MKKKIIIYQYFNEIKSILINKKLLKYTGKVNPYDNVIM